MGGSFIEALVAVCRGLRGVCRGVEVVCGDVVAFCGCGGVVVVVAVVVGVFELLTCITLSDPVAVRVSVAGLCGGLRALSDAPLAFCGAVGGGLDAAVNFDVEVLVVVVTLGVFVDLSVFPLAFWGSVSLWVMRFTAFGEVAVGLCEPPEGAGDGDGAAAAAAGVGAGVGGDCGIDPEGS